MGSNGSAWTAAAVVVVGVMALGTAKDVIRDTPLQAGVVTAGGVIGAKLVRNGSGPGGQAARNAAREATGGGRTGTGPAGASREPSGPKRQTTPTTAAARPAGGGGGVAATEGPGLPELGGSGIAGSLGRVLGELGP